MYDQFSETEVFVIKKLRILPVFAALLLLIGCAAQGTAEDVAQDESNANVAAEELKRALGKFDASDAVFNKELKPADELVKIEIQFYDSYLYSVDDTDCLWEIGEQFGSAMVIPYTPKTFNPDATLHFEYADGSITTLATDLGAYVFCLNDIYYNFAFRENGENLSQKTDEMLRKWLDTDDWATSVFEKYRVGSLGSIYLRPNTGEG